MLLRIGRINLQRGEALDSLEEHAAQIGVAAPIIAHGAAGDFLHGHDRRRNERHAHEQRDGGRKRQRRERHEQRNGRNQGIEQLGHILAEIALELLGAFNAHLHGNARCDGFAVGGAKGDEFIVDLLANDAFRLSGRALPHALRRRLARHAHDNCRHGSGHHANRHSGVGRALERGLQKYANHNEQRDVAHERYPLEQHVGKNVFCGARHHSKQAFIEHFSPVFAFANVISCTGLMVTQATLLWRLSKRPPRVSMLAAGHRNKKTRNSGAALRNSGGIIPHARARRPRHRSPWQ